MSAQRFDYVIVGAGSAGCVLANRLSADPSVSVLLIEAGARLRNPAAFMPMAIPFFFNRPDINWNLESEPEAALGGRRLLLPRGKVMGGCSSINGMTFARGHKLDYDDWAAAGAPGWSYADVLPYFRRLEASWSDDTEYRGSDGPIGVQRNDHPRLMFDDFASAAHDAGHDVTPDYHSGQSEGLAKQELTTVRGRRASTSRVYLDPVRRRKNLTVISRAEVRRIVIAGQRAIGVEALIGGGISQFAAKREVILSAGAYGSPQLLMLSGIGPADHLREVGIEPVLDAPGVGAGLIEHPLVPMIFNTGPGTLLEELRLDRALVSAARWMMFGTGPFASNTCPANLFLRTNRTEDRPDTQVMFTSLSLGSALWNPLGKSPQHSVCAFVTLLRQESRGHVRLRSADPATPPSITLNLLSSKIDMDRMIAGIRRTREVFAQRAFATRGANEIMPGPALQSDSELAAFLRENVQVSHHPVSTCRMGSDNLAVVDPELRVQGVAGLRVVDASVMPTIPGGNTNVPTIMIAERAGDLIRDQQLAAAA